MYALNVARYKRYPDVKSTGVYGLPRLCVLTSEKVHLLQVLSKYYKFQITAILKKNDCNLNSDGGAKDSDNM
jgi:hypothetical protein